MMDIERISKKIREEKDNLVAKAFTCQIASLLLTNGIVPIMSEYRKEDLDLITDADKYKLVYELGVTFDSLDTSEHDKQVRTDDIEECIDILNNSIPLVDNKDIVFGFKCAVERLEQLKEHNEQNSIIEALKPRGCDDMPKEIICNCTKELTYREIFEHFLEKCETKSPIEDYRPCIPMYGVPDIPYAIVIWLADGTKIIYIDK